MEEAAKSAVEKANSDMYRAVIKKREGDLAAAVEAGANVDARSWAGTTPLMFAALNGREACLRVLLAAGARVDLVRLPKEETALMFAAYGGHEGCVGLLLAAGADVEAKDEFDRTALMFAALSGDARCVEALLAAGADAMARMGDGRVALDLCAEGSPCWTMLEAAREARVLEKAVVKAGPGARKAVL